MNEINDLLKTLSKIDQQCRSKIDCVKRHSSSSDVDSARLDVVKNRFETKMKAEATSATSKKRRALVRLKEEDELLEKMVEDAKKMANMKIMKKKPCGTGGSEYKMKEKSNWENAKRSLVSKIEMSVRKEEEEREKMQKARISERRLDTERRMLSRQAAQERRIRERQREMQLRAEKAALDARNERQRGRERQQLIAERRALDRRQVQRAMNFVAQQLGFGRSMQMSTRVSSVPAPVLLTPEQRAFYVELPNLIRAYGRRYSLDALSVEAVLDFFANISFGGLRVDSSKSFHDALLVVSGEKEFCREEDENKDEEKIRTVEERFEPNWLSDIIRRDDIVFLVRLLYSTKKERTASEWIQRALNFLCKHLVREEEKIMQETLLDVHDVSTCLNLILIAHRCERTKDITELTKRFEAKDLSALSKRLVSTKSESEFDEIVSKHLGRDATSSSSRNSSQSLFFSAATGMCGATSTSTFSQHHKRAQDVKQTYFKRNPLRSVDEIFENLEYENKTELRKILNLCLKSIERVMSETASREDVRSRIEAARKHMEQKYDSVATLPIPELSSLLALLAWAVKLDRGYELRTSQILAIILLLQRSVKTSVNCGILLQIRTGEGKSCIIACVSAILGMFNRRVDIVTSSPPLALRDASSWRSFYALFELRCRATQPGMDLAAEAVFSSDILYSTVHELSCAVLIERFQGHTSARLDKDFKVRGFDVVILDEVDALLVDSGVSTHYLTATLPGAQHLETILGTIWGHLHLYRPSPKVGENTFGYFLHQPSPWFLSAFGQLSKILNIEDPLQLTTFAEQNHLLPSSYSEQAVRSLSTTLRRQYMIENTTLSNLSSTTSSSSFYISETNTKQLENARRRARVLQLDEPIPLQDMTQPTKRQSFFRHDDQVSSPIHDVDEPAAPAEAVIATLLGLRRFLPSGTNIRVWRESEDGTGIQEVLHHQSRKKNMTDSTKSTKMFLVHNSGLVSNMMTKEQLFEIVKKRVQDLVIFEAQFPPDRKSHNHHDTSNNSSKKKPLRLIGFSSADADSDDSRNASDFEAEDFDVEDDDAITTTTTTTTHEENDEQVPSSVNERRKLVMPLFLKDFVSRELKNFIESAFCALSMTRDREYVIENGCIYPVDFANSGVLEKNKRWGQGLQQFLEFRHGLPRTTLSIVTNYISNAAFFKKYLESSSGVLLGLTGTLGDEADCEFLKEQYRSSKNQSLEVCRIPLSRSSQLRRSKLIRSEDRSSWSSSIMNAVRIVVKEERRAALVICEDLRTAREIQDRILRNGFARNVFLYARDDRDHGFLEKERHSGDVIVATNLAGRGTDIRVSRGVQRRGGLAVFITFLPRNLRVEEQAAGRTCRKGEPGSVQMIIDTSKLNLTYRQCASSHELFRKRAEQMERWITQCKRIDLPVASAKDVLFDRYLLLLDSLRPLLRGRWDRDMILAVEHEKWGLWLNRASTLLNDAAKEKHLSSTLLNLLNERDDLHCEILKRHREYSSTLIKANEHKRKARDATLLLGHHVIETLVTRHHRFLQRVAPALPYVRRHLRVSGVKGLDPVLKPSYHVPIFVPYASPKRLKEWYDLVRVALRKKAKKSKDNLDEEEEEDTVERHIQDVYDMVETSIVVQARLESFESIEPSRRKEMSSYSKKNFENLQWFSNQAQTPRSFVEWLEQSWAQWLHHETGRVNFDALSEAHARFQDQVDVVREQSVWTPIQSGLRRDLIHKNVYNLIKFGTSELKAGDLDAAWRWYTAAIECEPRWACFAFYYRACITLQKGFHMSPEEVRQNSLKDLRLCRKSLSHLRQELMNIEGIGALTSFSAASVGFSFHEKDICEEDDGEYMDDIAKNKGRSSFEGGRVRLQIYSHFLNHVKQLSARLQHSNAITIPRGGNWKTIFEIIPAFDEEVSDTYMQLCQVHHLGLEVLFEMDGTLCSSDNISHSYHMKTTQHVEFSRVCHDEKTGTILEPFHWRACAVAVWDVLQCAVGSVLCACGGGSVGVLSHSIGTAILIRGVQDFIAGVAGMWTGEFDVRQWAIDACVAIAVDVAAVGCAGCV